jgi:hypothetical protein
MTSPLVIIGHDPVHLEGHLDSADALQVKHGSNTLNDYGQSLEARHADLRSSSATIRVELGDFSSGGDNWQITATHAVSGSPVSWTRGTTMAYCDFAAMTDALEVDVLATSNASPPATKARKIWIKTMPLDGQ